PNTNFYRAPEHGDDIEAFGAWAADEIGRAIEREGPDTVAAVYLEPVQNAGGCFPPPPGYFERVRNICDRHGVLLVSDEVICAFGRLGEWFGSHRYGYQPDLITVAKGLTSGYAPLGAMIATDRLVEPFLHGDRSFAHGFTFAGHPVSCAVAMTNLDVFEHDDILGHVRSTEAAFRSGLDTLLDLPIVGEVRGAGFFYGIELVRDKTTRESFGHEESERLLRGYLSGALFEAGLICRADDRGDPVVQLSPPLICGQEDIDLMVDILRTVLSEAWHRI
ncbi:MAG: aminotransferase class III-fold pyridoxal phosphate-dependent enzyme, partial [Acidimicrobiales bacterium]